MNDLISREDAIKAVAIAALDDRDELEAIKALPSADAVSMEEHIKELNDLAVEWKAKFAKAEKITDEIYDETMAKVAKECEKCKERLRNIRQSAEAVQGWTPCSERLPKPWENVMTTICWVGDEYEDDYDIAVGFKKISGDWDLTLADGTGVIKGFLVQAWMPLPKPYIDESEVEE